MKKRNILLILAIIGTLGIIATSLPLIEVSVDEYYLEIHKVWGFMMWMRKAPDKKDQVWENTLIGYIGCDNQEASQR